MVSIEDIPDPIILEENWQDDANCLGVDPDLFFPERGASTREAKEVCRGCVVREQCLEFALQNGEKFGIWGGLSERERRRIRRQRAQTARNIIGTVSDGANELTGSTSLQCDQVGAGIGVVVLSSAANFQTQDFQM
jgi:WhiB family redox-sensing transcriptional regulator